jgi:hypothetical protein
MTAPATPPAMGIMLLSELSCFVSSSLDPNSFAASALVDEVAVAPAEPVALYIALLEYVELAVGWAWVVESLTVATTRSLAALQ